MKWLSKISFRSIERWIRLQYDNAIGWQRLKCAYEYEYELEHERRTNKYCRSAQLEKIFDSHSVRKSLTQEHLRKLATVRAEDEIIIWATFSTATYRNSIITKLLLINMINQKKCWKKYSNFSDLNSTDEKRKNPFQIQNSQVDCERYIMYRSTYAKYTFSQGRFLPVL